MDYAENILETIIKTKNLNQTLECFEKYNNNKYIVAWIDTNKVNEYLGRSIIYLGKHSNSKKNYFNNTNFKLPFEFPSFFLNSQLLKNRDSSIFLKLFY